MFDPIHHTSYDAISPLKQANSHKGKTVLVTGAGTGVGYSIALSFAQAGAKCVVILGRREDVITDAARHIKKSDGVTSEIISHSCDIASSSDVDSVFAELGKRDVNVDILVLNAAKIADRGLLMPEEGDRIAEIVESFDINVKGNFYMTQKFIRQQASSHEERVILSISTGAAHVHIPMQGVYATSKAASAMLFQDLAEELAGKVRLINIHPGTIFSEPVQKAGLTREGGVPLPMGTIPFDDDDLPGHFCVWAASPAAAFLHARFVWSAWDVSALEGMKESLAQNPFLLKLGLIGWDPSEMMRMVKPKNDAN